MKEKVLYSRNSEGNYEVAVGAIDDWGAFEKLMKYLISIHGAEVIDLAEGPDMTVCCLLLQEEKIDLVYADDYGNYLTAHSAAGERLITAIGKELEICFHYLPS
jgi:hypothetical protein